MGGCLRRKARGFPHSRRQSRFFCDFDATLFVRQPLLMATKNPAWPRDFYAAYKIYLFDLLYLVS
jgi:hypothetical protein